MHRQSLDWPQLPQVSQIISQSVNLASCMSRWRGLMGIKDGKPEQVTEDNNKPPTEPGKPSKEQMGIALTLNVACILVLNASWSSKTCFVFCLNGAQSTQNHTSYSTLLQVTTLIPQNSTSTCFSVPSPVMKNIIVAKASIRCVYKAVKVCFCALVRGGEAPTQPRQLILDGFLN